MSASPPACVRSAPPLFRRLPAAQVRILRPSSIPPLSLVTPFTTPSPPSHQPLWRYFSAPPLSLRDPLSGDDNNKRQRTAEASLVLRPPCCDGQPHMDCAPKPRCKVAPGFTTLPWATDNTHTPTKRSPSLAESMSNFELTTTCKQSSIPNAFQRGVFRQDNSRPGVSRRYDHQAGVGDCEGCGRVVVSATCRRSALEHYCQQLRSLGNRTSHRARGNATQAGNNEGPPTNMHCPLDRSNRRATRLQPSLGRQGVHVREQQRGGDDAKRLRRHPATLFGLKNKSASATRQYSEARSHAWHNHTVGGGGQEFPKRVWLDTHCAVMHSSL